MSDASFIREVSLARIRDRRRPWDIVVVGGGATGVGIALDAASRGLDVVLLEADDFGKGTSSRSTKLVHGGVRYLRQGNVTLVRDALRERTLLRNNAPHLVHDVAFLIPCRNSWERFFYGVGLKAYDFLATGNRFGRSRGVSSDEAARLVPQLRPDQHAGGVVYHDGQFDDSRLLINMAQSAQEAGGCLCNYISVEGFIKDDAHKIIGVIAVDRESLETFHMEAKCVINAAGPFCDAVRRLDDTDCEPMIVPSQGVHLVLPRRFLSGDTAVIVPKTSDGRVLFIIPWHDRAVRWDNGHADSRGKLEPSATQDEIEFLLETASQYLTHAPTIDDVLSIFTGIRPLVKGDKSAKTASLARDHVIRFSSSGLLTITGGKWTTVRKMAEDCVDRAIEATGLTANPCRTVTLRLRGAPDDTVEGDDHVTCDHPVEKDPRSYYGADLREVIQLEAADPSLAQTLHESLSIRRSDILWAVRYEMARTIEDVLARRTRSLFVDAGASLAIAPQVAQTMAAELGRDDAWSADQLERFENVAQHFLPHLLSNQSPN